MKKNKIIELINKYWKFDGGQQPISTWHDKNDLITEIELSSNNNPVITVGDIDKDGFCYLYKDGILVDNLKILTFTPDQVDAINASN